MSGPSDIMRVDISGWERAVRGLAERFGVGAADVMRYQFALWGQDLVRKQWPQAKDARRAIENDVKRCFNTPRTPVKAAPQQDPAEFHEASRDTRTGRVRREYGRHGSAFRLVVGGREARAVTRDAQRSVGRVKAGWLAMVRKFGGKSQPGYVTRHGAREGVAFDRMDRKGNGYLSAENSVPYAARMDHGVLALTARVRQRDLDRNMEKRAEQFAAWFNRQG